MVSADEPAGGYGLGYRIPLSNRIVTDVTWWRLTEISPGLGSRVWLSVVRLAQIATGPQARGEPSVGPGPRGGGHRSGRLTPDMTTNTQ